MAPPSAGSDAQSLQVHGACKRLPRWQSPRTHTAICNVFAAARCQLVAAGLQIRPPHRNAAAGPVRRARETAQPCVRHRATSARQSRRAEFDGHQQFVQGHTHAAGGHAKERGADGRTHRGTATHHPAPAQEAGGTVSGGVGLLPPGRDPLHHRIVDFKCQFS